MSLCCNLAIMVLATLLFEQYFARPPGADPSAEMEEWKHVLCYLKTLNGLIFVPVFLIPYYLRGIRLRALFLQHRKYVVQYMKQGKVTFQKIESSYCIREGNIALWFLLIVAGFSALGFADVFSDFHYHQYLPMHSFCECIPFADNIEPHSRDQLTPDAEEWIETQTLVSFSFDALEILLLAAVLYRIRWLPREFSVMNELAMIMYLRVLQMGCGYLILVVDFRDIFLTNLIYIMVITVFDFFQMLVSAAYILW